LIPEGEKAKGIHFPHDFNAYLIEAIKALDAENTALEQQNADLEARVAALEALVESLLEKKSE
jgi:cell division protein FtsB